MGAVSFEQVQEHNILLQTAVKQLAIPPETPLHILFEGIRKDLNCLTWGLPKKVSNETKKQFSEEIYAKLRNIADFLDPALPGYAILHKLMTSSPVKMEEEKVVAEFTEQQKKILSSINQLMMDCFMRQQNESIFLEKAIKHPRRGIPILTRMGTLVGRLSPQVIDDKTCAETLKVYTYILEHHATSYPGQLGPTMPTCLINNFENVVKILPTSQEELNTLIARGEGKHQTQRANYKDVVVYH